jgi:hypothetical protein
MTGLSHAGDASVGMGRPVLTAVTVLTAAVMEFNNSQTVFLTQAHQSAT